MNFSQDEQNKPKRIRTLVDEITIDIRLSHHIIGSLSKEFELDVIEVTENGIPKRLNIKAYNVAN